LWWVGYFNVEVGQDTLTPTHPTNDFILGRAIKLEEFAFLTPTIRFVEKTTDRHGRWRSLAMTDIYPGVDDDGQLVVGQVHHLYLTLRLR